ncbi:PREDICTED: uncharacterized protein LOC105459636 isoform X1 [Wasmannia auropunctata]|uniref:uncharacterized protein LOC105459636 isoform X1 n=1 Tax=Wasmannia auropunctata TaxID=64793 RepID=UPI0005EE5595|nr:PREDICTED: uncharacterized protein LOC105459636 isoform X1 [Wasmannia auropunctata]
MDTKYRQNEPTAAARICLSIVISMLDKVMHISIFVRKYILWLNTQFCRRTLGIELILSKCQNINISYLFQDHFTDDQFELGRADHRRLLKWNSVPTIFPRCKAQNIKCRRPPKREAIVLAKDESSMNSPEKATMDENLNTEIRIRRTEVNEESCNDDIMEENLNTELGLREIEVNKERCKDSTDEVVALKCKLNASLKEIHTLRTIIFQLQEIIKRLVEEKHVDET